MKLIRTLYVFNVILLLLLLNSEGCFIHFFLFVPVVILISFSNTLNQFQASDVYFGVLNTEQFDTSISFRCLFCVFFFATRISKQHLKNQRLCITIIIRNRNRYRQSGAILFYWLHLAFIATYFVCCLFFFFVVILFKRKILKMARESLS